MAISIRKVGIVILSFVLFCFSVVPASASSSAVEGVDYHSIVFTSSDYDDFKYLLVFRGTNGSYGDYMNYYISDQPFVIKSNKVYSQPGSKFCFCSSSIYLSKRPLSETINWGSRIYESGDSYSELSNHTTITFVASNFNVVDISSDNEVIYSCNTSWQGYTESSSDAFSDIVSTIGSVFNSFMSWIADICTAVISSPILLLFCLLPLVGLGVGLFIRVLL